jgi:release factor glutamine methyltransferase
LPNCQSPCSCAASSILDRMTNGKWLAGATKQLQEAGIGTARLDALVLLEDVVGKNRAWLLANPDFVLSHQQVTKLKKLLNRRAGHEPLAYIRGRAEFYGREFVLTSAVLQPRPESETMIDLLKELPIFDTKSAQALYIADVGTGSGALGITAQLELPQATVDLLEINDKALKVAKTNVVKFTLGINVICSDLLSQSKRNYDVLLCNLPYVPDDFQINPAALREPRLAIFGGPDGLDVYRRLFSQIEKMPKQPLYILTEALPPQHLQLAGIAQSAGYELQQTVDFIQVFSH